MKRALAALSIAFAGPAMAAPGGPIGILVPGTYACELPGDATGPVGIRAPEHDFTITNASSYSTAKGAGTYLLTGDKVQMTSGPQKGLSYRRQSGGFLRRLNADGSDSTLRCILGVANNQR
ncbi:hypothetical protein [Novosphingobium sp. TH158]|uniref:hypothetical protein n=1 Tax=Novosphingobium sp. TH158 TaxID=2067455 RepID=UPI000C7B610A|nr:hypothetical protein [Novosphingobium sp. TH158]PLK26024.1 hypothetical protein C0V78_03335 [Novosphingobium sp. TH158]